MRGKGRHGAASAEAQVDILSPKTCTRCASSNVITPHMSSRVAAAGEGGARPGTPSGRRSVARRRRVRVALHRERLLVSYRTLVLINPHQTRRGGFAAS